MRKFPFFESWSDWLSGGHPASGFKKEDDCQAAFPNMITITREGTGAIIVSRRVYREKERIRISGSVSVVEQHFKW
jgi:hypothetical protein